MKKHTLKINMLLNIIKQCCNIIIPLITYPYVSRILGATNYGKYSFADSVINIFMTIACLGIPTYAIREGARLRNDKTKITQFSAEVYTINILSLVVTLFSLVIIVKIVPRFYKDALIIYILSFNIVTSILGRDWLNNIYEDFAYITLRYIFFQIISIVLIFAFVKNSDDYIKYACITLVANSGGYIFNFFYTQKFVPLKITNKINLKRHIKPILLLWGVALAIQIYIMSDVTILGFFQPDDQVGIYSLSSKVYTIIKSLLNAVIIVTIPRISNCLGEGEKKEYILVAKEVQDILYTLIFPTVVGLFMESKNIILLIGGSEYEAGATVIKILCIALIFAVFGCFYAQIILVPTRNDKYFFTATVFSAIINIVLNFLFIPQIGICGAALTTVIAEGCVMVICMHYASIIYPIHKNRNFLSILLGCLCIIGVCTIINQTHYSIIIKTFFSIIISCGLYFGVAIMCKNSVVIEFYYMIKNSRKS